MMGAPRKIRMARGGALNLRSANASLHILSAIGLALGVVLLYFTVQPSPDIALPVFGSAISIFVITGTVLFFLLPTFISNELTQSNLILRYGILFRLEVPLSRISKIEVLDRLPGPSLLLGRGFRIGVEYSVIDRRFVVLRSRRGVIRMSLNEEIRGRDWLVSKRVKEVVFDTLDYAIIKKRLEEARI